MKPGEFCVAAACAVCAIGFLAADLGRPTKNTVKTRISPAQHERFMVARSHTNEALQTWKAEKNPRKAAKMLEAQRARHELVTCPISDLAEMYRDASEYHKALEVYRSIYVYPHKWSSTEEQNLTTIGEYIAVARKVGARSDVLRGDRLVLKYYRPLGQSPVLEPPDEGFNTLDAYANAALSENRGEHRNGVKQAAMAVSERPRDGLLRWLLGSALFDAQRLPEAKSHFLIAHRLGGLDAERERLMDGWMLDLVLTKADETILRESPVEVAAPPVGPPLRGIGLKTVDYDPYTGRQTVRP